VTEGGRGLRPTHSLHLAHLLAAPVVAPGCLGTWYEIHRHKLQVLGEVIES
jgi:hypothetical protein